MATTQHKPTSAGSDDLSPDLNGLFAHLPPQDATWSQLFTSPDQWNSNPSARAYGHYMRRAWEDNDLGVRAILCIENRPTVYFKAVDRYDPAAEARAQQALWNQGIATILVVCDPTQVRIYSAFVQPQKALDQHFNLAEELSQRQIGDTLERAAFTLELVHWLRRIETGQFYRDNATKFEPEQAVDRGLLRNLSAASDKLCEGENGLSRKTTHALLGRILFVRYLCDRKIIDDRYLSEKTEILNAPQPREWLENLSPTLIARDQLYKFFTAIQDDFNGSFFGEDLEQERLQIEEHHLDVLGHLLRGTDLATGQLSLFPFYNFKLIPIETISAIYESFISAEDQQKIEDGGDGEKERNFMVKGASGFGIPAPNYPLL
jgi:hypothetical protein